MVQSRSVDKSLNADEANKTSINQSINQSKQICIAPCHERIRGAYQQRLGWVFTFTAKQYQTSAQKCWDVRRIYSSTTLRQNCSVKQYDIKKRTHPTVNQQQSWPSGRDLHVESKFFLKRRQWILHHKYHWLHTPADRTFHSSSPAHRQPTVHAA